MPRCQVSIRHVRIRKIFFVEEAADDADAIRQFLEAIDLPTKNVPDETAPHGGWPINVDWLGAAPPAPQPSAPQSMPKTAAEAIAAEAVAEPSEAPVSLDDLKAFGIPDNDVADLRKIGLITMPAIIAYAQEHKGLTSVPGIGAVGDAKIKAAIKAYQANEA